MEFKLPRGVPKKAKKLSIEDCVKIYRGYKVEKPQGKGCSFNCPLSGIALNSESLCDDGGNESWSVCELLYYIENPQG